MKLEINGFPVEAQYDEGTVQGIFMPFLRQMGRLQRARRGRLIVFLAAPPATGKSTLAAFLQQLAGEMEDLPPVQALGMDGFHYPQAYIRTHTVVCCGRSWRR